jgi:CHAT domain-containing protein
MARSKFDELAIKLDPAPDGRFRATVMSPKTFAGRDTTFSIPPGLVERLDALSSQAIGRHTRAIGQHGMPGRPAAPDLDLLGSELFALLFQHGVRDAYNELQKVRKSSNKPQRLRLQISRDAAALLRVPWELLKADSSRLALVGSIVRDLQTDLEVTTPRPPPEINVLVVAADPPTLRALAIEQERRGIEDAFATAHGGKVRVEVVAGKWDALEERLSAAQHANRHFHVFHYIGHGGTRGQESFLCFERDGAVEEVSGQRLAELLLARAPTIRLAFINACHSSAVSASDAFGGLAQALVGAHIPVTIAMQFAVSDRAATEFSASLYRMLAANTPIEEALLEARRALERSHPSEWATPTVFMATDSVELFRLARSFDRAARPAAPAGRLVAPQVAGPSPWAALERTRSELAEARRLLTIAELCGTGPCTQHCADLAAESLRAARAAAHRAQAVVKAIEPPPASGSLRNDLRPVVLRYLRNVCDPTGPLTAGAIADRLRRLDDVFELLPGVAPEPRSIAAERAAWELVGCWRAVHALAAIMQAVPQLAGDLTWLLAMLVDSASSIGTGKLPATSADTVADIEQAVAAVRRNLRLGRLDRVLDAAARVVEEASHVAEPAVEVLASVA